jgi:multidrug efflux pump subunit AcrA (membrane-fusion protein)
MAGTVVVITGTISRALVIPRTALVRNDEDNTYSVVSITADSLAMHLPVEVGVFADSIVQISGGGITPGLDVITEGNYALADSTRVIIAGNVPR